jgi:hypothetical protein
VGDLIVLKQQQASIVQAYQAMKEGEETMRQGKTILLFTIMTVVFVMRPAPLAHRLTKL